MTNDASWRVQVSIKTPAGTLINCRGDNGDEVLGQLKWVYDHAAEIHATEQGLSATGTVAAAMPLAPPAQQPPAPPQQQGFGQGFQPAQQAPQQQPQQQWAQQPAFAGPQQGGQNLQVVPQQQPQPQPGLQAVGQQPGPVCNHGIAAKYVAGGISKTGRPYKAFWACSLGREQDCRFRQDAA